MDKHSILIAEDDEDDHTLLQKAFEESGLPEKLVFVENGIELIDYLFLLNAKGPYVRYPAYILLDLNMPRKNGFEVLQELKQHPQLKRIPVLIFSTTSNENEVLRCYEMGANSYIKKPVSYNALTQLVQQISFYWLKIATVPGKGFYTF